MCLEPLASATPCRSVSLARAHLPAPRGRSGVAPTGRGQHRGPRRRNPRNAAPSLGFRSTWHHWRLVPRTDLDLRVELLLRAAADLHHDRVRVREQANEPQGVVPGTSDGDGFGLSGGPATASRPCGPRCRVRGERR